MKNELQSYFENMNKSVLNPFFLTNVMEFKIYLGQL